MDFETLLYEERHKVAYITLNRPEVHNAFNIQMQVELRAVWQSLRLNGGVNAAVITGEGPKAFCTGIDRTETMSEYGQRERKVGAVGGSPFMFDDPGANVGPKANDCWKPVIAAVNGMACGGAFYILGEADIIVAADHATFFDPHVTYGMAASFESMHMLQKMPLGEVIRMQLLGNFERMSAQRAHQIGAVSEVFSSSELMGAASWIAETIASQPSLPVQATLRAIWAANDLGRRAALEQGYAFIGLGSNAETLREGQERFASGERVAYRTR